MNEHLNLAKQAGDVTASLGAAIALVSHWAQTLTPILTFIVALASAGWWLLRYIEHFATKKSSKG